VKGKQQLTLVF